MLIEFRVANHRSLRDEQVLTMEAGRVGDEADPRPRHVSGHSESLLTVAGLYGANASGKSNVLAALAFMCEAVVMSHRFWSPDEGEPREPFVPRDPFAWGPKKTEPSLFEVTLLLDHVRYQYGFQVSDEQFLEEWLYAWPNGKKQVWFERENQYVQVRRQLEGREQGHRGGHSTECLVPFGRRAAQAPAASADLRVVSIDSSYQHARRSLSLSSISNGVRTSHWLGC